MKATTLITAATLACSAAHGITIDPDVYFAVARMEHGKSTYLLSKQACKYATSEKSKWMKATVYTRNYLGIMQIIDACWMKDSTVKDEFNQPSDLKVCMILDGKIRTTCKNDKFGTYIRTSDLPKAPSQADF